MQRAVGGILGAVAGLGFTTMGLIHTGNGLDFGGGNEASTIVIVAGIIIGGVIGGFLLWRQPLVIAGMIFGLTWGIWLRDNLTFGGVQPPWVFVLLFGLPAVGAAGGYLIHRSSVHV